MSTIPISSVTVSPTTFTHGQTYPWAIRNKKIGAQSLASGLAATACDLGKKVLPSGSTSYRFIDFIRSILSGIRANRQYTLYGSKVDDDLGEDLVKRKAASNFGQTACVTERFVIPILLPSLKLVGENVSEAFEIICHLPNALWWRSRFFNDGVELPNLNILRNDFNLLYTDNNKIAKDARENISDTLSPALGLIGFAFTGFFTPIKAWNRLMGSENIVINMLSSIGSATQHVIYFFRFSLANLFDYMSDKETPDKVLSTIGIAANAMNVMQPVVDIIPEGNGIVDNAKDIYRTLSTGTTQAYFSTRRHINGKRWIQKNPDAQCEVAAA